MGLLDFIRTKNTSKNAARDLVLIANFDQSDSDTIADLKSKLENAKIYFNLNSSATELSVKEADAEKAVNILKSITAASSKPGTSMKSVDTNTKTGIPSSTKCCLCNMKREGGKPVSGAIIASWRKFFKEMEDETVRTYASLGINGAEIVRKTQDEYRNSDALHYVCPTCLERYS